MRVNTEAQYSHIKDAVAAGFLTVFSRSCCEGALGGGGGGTITSSTSPASSSISFCSSNAGAGTVDLGALDFLGAFGALDALGGVKALGEGALRLLLCWIGGRTSIVTAGGLTELKSHVEILLFSKIAFRLASGISRLFKKDAIKFGALSSGYWGSEGGSGVATRGAG